jgi:hypothetical protein
VATVSIAWDSPGAQFDPLGANFPQPVRIAGTNFTVEGLAFDASTVESCCTKFTAISYGSGNLTLKLRWYADTASTNDVVWSCAIAAITPDTDTQDVETDTLATEQTVTDTHLGTTGQRVHTCSITVSNLDSIAANDLVFLRISRNATSGSDTLAGDAILLSAILEYSDT